MSKGHNETMVARASAGLKAAGDISPEMTSLLDVLIPTARLLDRLSPPERMALFLAHKTEVLVARVKDLEGKLERGGKTNG